MAPRTTGKITLRDDVAMRRRQAQEYAASLGAARINHPGGDLLAHLDRTADLLAQWGSGDDLVDAGQCHAVYGTDGFPSELLPISRRSEVAAVIGDRSEALVYLLCQL